MTESTSFQDVPLGYAEETNEKDIPCHLRWSRITKTVEVVEANAGLLNSSISSNTSTIAKKGPTLKTILNEVSGCANPGEIMALMGPSGSGKTSLLDALSGRSQFNSGKIVFNNIQVTRTVMKKLKSKIAYVKQNDIFFTHLTVRDQLTYTALLRLPPSYSKVEKHAEVDRILVQLRLLNCADTPIIMISGGERKRVNIGTELLTDPKAILLDEPTSGLDSTSAVALMQMLSGLARDSKKTIITSIHQPSSAVFQSFDKLMLLADGNTVYFGTPKDSLTYLTNIGYPTPAGYNVADHWMDLLVIDSSIDTSMRSTGILNDDKEESNTDRASSTEEKKDDIVKPYPEHSILNLRMAMIASWDNEIFTDNVDNEISKSGEGKKNSNIDWLENSAKYNTSWLTQFLILTHRAMKNSRSALFTPLNIIKSVILGVMVGLLWFQMPYTEKTVNDRSAYYFFTMTYWVFDSMFSALMAFPFERAIIFKERASGSYRLSAYFMAKTCSEAPTRLILPFLYMVVSFWLGNISRSFTVFMGSTACSLLSVLSGESIGLLIGTSVMDMDRAIVVATVYSLSTMVVGGFFISNIPAFATWVKYLSPFKYAFDASRQLVFDRNIPCDGSGGLETFCRNGVEFVTPEQVRTFLKVDGTVAFNAGMLTVLCLVPRCFAYYALKRHKGGERDS
mmetsp:Transcript_27897/g.32160  ORF Transcript_27897/g.32160 Transcript_27897/m.32160 type:complete len:678 (+) Transcript_27897:116-2149(+)|eukprot:CAMPEP_0194379412 /NCGR_PEP_ID=MMETSP0174-20130528/39734_1 /TAXON_ID=216777 /ORGANISM="Proboscia alata, Strain PI-D3" /LENGTH=677 /DNA_ID=CAMNT_0039162129 /DNA_START=175 /DNA_END=2208 /DNA_ORIENTATION=+